MIKIKTFPLRFTEDYLNSIGEKAKQQHLSKEDFIRMAIEKAMKEGN